MNLLVPGGIGRGICAKRARYAGNCDGGSTHFQEFQAYDKIL